MTNNCRQMPSVIEATRGTPHPPDKACLLRDPRGSISLGKDRDLGIHLSHSWKPLNSTSDTFLLRGWHHQTGAGGPSLGEARLALTCRNVWE